MKTKITKAQKWRDTLKGRGTLTDKMEQTVNAEIQKDEDALERLIRKGIELGQIDPNKTAKRSAS